MIDDIYMLLSVSCSAKYYLYKLTSRILCREIKEWFILVNITQSENKQLRHYIVIVLFVARVSTGFFLHRDVKRQPVHRPRSAERTCVTTLLSALKRVILMSAKLQFSCSVFFLPFPRISVTLCPCCYVTLYMRLSAHYAWYKYICGLRVTTAVYNIMTFGRLLSNSGTMYTIIIEYTMCTQGENPSLALLIHLSY